MIPKIKNIMPPHLEQLHDPFMSKVMISLYPWIFKILIKEPTTRHFLLMMCIGYFFSSLIKCTGFQLIINAIKIKGLSILSLP